MFLAIFLKTSHIFDTEKHFPNEKIRVFFSVELDNLDLMLPPSGLFLEKNSILKIMKSDPLLATLPAITYAAPTSGWARELIPMILVHNDDRFSLVMSI